MKQTKTYSLYNILHLAVENKNLFFLHRKSVTKQDKQTNIPLIKCSGSGIYQLESLYMQSTSSVPSPTSLSAVNKSVIFTAYYTIETLETRLKHKEEFHSNK